MSTTVRSKLRNGLLILFGVLVLGVSLVGTYEMIRANGKVKDTGTNDTNSNQTPKAYMALGDSVAAGIGLEPASDSSACNRSDKSYPRLLANAKNYNLTNLACSGATLGAGINGPQEINKLAAPPQLQQLFASPRPDLVTLTIGANDAGWTRFIGECYRSACNTPQNTAAFAQQLPAIAGGLTQALDGIRKQYSNDTNKPPQVMLVTYYQVFPATPADPAKCSDIAGVDAAEQQWVRQQIDSLNSSLGQAAKNFSFVTVATPDFSGHELCSADPTSVFVQGLNDKEPYHPTEAGQKSLADSIAKQLKETP